MHITLEFIYNWQNMWFVSKPKNISAQIALTAKFKLCSKHYIVMHKTQLLNIANIEFNKFLCNLKTY